MVITPLPFISNSLRIYILLAPTNHQDHPKNQPCQTVQVLEAAAVEAVEA
jgi:hypothetical protein